MFEFVVHEPPEYSFPVTLTRWAFSFAWQHKTRQTFQLAVGAVVFTQRLKLSGGFMRRLMSSNEFWFALSLSICGISAHAAERWQAPRMPWGAPDLQGTWTNASITALERDDAYKGRASMTLAEAAEFEKNSPFAKYAAEDAKPTNPNEKASSSSDPGGYNAFWLDPGMKLAVVNGEARTSFIVDPPNGKIPYTPAGLKAFAAARASMRF